MENTITAVKAIVEEADRMKNSYFWDSPGSAGARRYYEKQHSHDLTAWEEGGHKYTAEYKVSCSCRNVYAKGIYTKDGKVTTLTAIKNSLKRMEGNIRAAEKVRQAP